MDAFRSSLAKRRRPNIYYGYVIVVLAAFILSITFGTYFSFGIFFKPLLAEFGWTRATISGAFLLSSIIYGSIGIATGALNDRFGPRLVLSICGLFLGAGYLLMSQVTAVWQLYLLYGVLIGAGMSGTYVPMASTTARWFAGKRGVMTGIVVAGVGIGSLVGPVVISRLISNLDWRLSYLALGSTILLLVISAAQFLKRDPSQITGKHYHWSQEREPEVPSGTEGLSLREVVFTRQFWLFFWAYFCFGFWEIAVVIHIVPHATDLGFSITSAANILAAIGGVTILSRIMWGSAIDKIGNKKVVFVGFGLAAASLIWLTSITDIQTLYLFAVVFGLAYGACSAAQSPLVAELFGLRAHGVIVGVIESGLALGGGIGPFVVGYIFDVDGSYYVAFLVCAAVSIIAIVLTLLLTPISKLKVR